MRSAMRTHSLSCSSLLWPQFPMQPHADEGVPGVLSSVDVTSVLFRLLQRLPPHPTPSPPQTRPPPAIYEGLLPSNSAIFYDADLRPQLTGNPLATHWQPAAPCGKDNSAPAKYLHNENPSLVAPGKTFRTIVSVFLLLYTINHITICSK